MGRDAIAFLGAVALSLFGSWRRFRWRDVWYYLDLCGGKSLGIVLLLCYLMGVVLGFQAAIQMRKFGTEIFVADLVGFALLKELGPLMVAMVETGRAGSAFAAEIGTMKVDEEVEALATLGIDVERFLVLPKLLALAVAMPLLTIFGDVAGLLGGMTVGVGMLEIPITAYYLRTVEVLSPMTFFLGTIKSVVFAVLIALAGCFCGFRATRDAQGVGRGATDAVISSIFLVIIADAIISVVYWPFGY